MKARPTPAHTAGAAAFLPALLAIILLCTAVRTASAQELPLTTFEGSIRYAGTSKPAICYVIVSRTEDGVAIGYTTTDGEGHYTLSIRSEADSVVIAVSGMSVKAVRRTVHNVSGRHDFEVKESLFELDEVTVTAPKMEMKGDDTVSYNVASFRAQEDLVIEDVLRKLPGITVRDNGQILYKAKPIAGLTIDGMDLLKGRYGIATRNISPDHIASVEILENHQAIKALKDLVPSDKTYINLKLKASSRGGRGRRLRGRRPVERRGRAHVLRAQQPAHPHRQDQQHRRRPRVRAGRPHLRHRQAQPGALLRHSRLAPGH